MPPSPGEPAGQESVHPEEDGGPRENREEEGSLAAENRPKDIQIPDAREPGPIDQEATRQARYDEAGQDDDNSDCDASSWHYPASLLCSHLELRRPNPVSGAQYEQRHPNPARLDHHHPLAPAIED